MEKDLNKARIEQSIADTIIERPHGFKIDSRRFYLYPITLGKMYLIGRIMDSLEINNEFININPYMEALRLAKWKKNEVCRLIAYHTLNKKEELFDNDIIEERVEYFTNNLDDEELAQLLMVVIAGDNINDFIKHFQLDKEREAMNKVLKCKKDTGNSFTFGGKSIYGTLIDTACERYKWTFDYVVWGISYNNLQMLMADKVNSIYLTDEEKKKCRVSRDRNIINGDDPKNIEKIKRLFS